MNEFFFKKINSRSEDVGHRKVLPDLQGKPAQFTVAACQQS